MADIPIWLQYLEAAGTVAGGLGLLGAVTAYWLQSRARRLQRTRELDGLLILLEDEVARNRIQLQAMTNNRRWITDSPPQNLRNAVWVEVRARLSDLLENEAQFNDFATYYGNLLVIEEFRLQDRLPEETQETVADWLPNLMKLSGTVEGHIRRYVPKAGEGTAWKAFGEALTRPDDQTSLTGKDG